MEIKIFPKEDFNVITACRVLRDMLLPGQGFYGNGGMKILKDISFHIKENREFTFNKYNIPFNLNIKYLEKALENQDYFDFQIYERDKEIKDKFKDLILMVHKEEKFNLLQDLTIVFNKYFD
jgi:hypothetical protein